MKKTLMAITFGVLLAGIAPAQIVPAPGRGHIRAFGEASVSVKPDLAKLSVSVITQAATAQEASAQNATKSTAVFDALEQAVGRSGEIKTISYMVTPNYTFPREASPVLTGFTATNVVEVSVSDLNLTGKLIDTAISAGATRVDSLRLMLKDEEPARAQALRLAGQKARTRAEAIASGLSVRVGPLVSAEEGFVYRIVPDTRTAAPAATTPIEPGTLEIRAQITVEYETLN
jgi:uncharacterized protein YggE